MKIRPKAQSPILAAAIATACLGGCASIFSGSTQNINFQSTPSGATVSISGVPIGATPMNTLIKRKNNQSLSVSKEGYKTFTTQMNTSIEPWFWGNILFGGVIGSVTDAVTGSMYKYGQDQYLVTLEPEGSSQISAPVEKSKKDQAREFIMLNYNPLMADLSKGGGSYLTSLIAILQVPKSDEPVAVERIKGFSQAFPDIGQFADQVTNAYVK
jgi:PEGA domain